MTDQKRPRPVMLAIMDGWGEREQLGTAGTAGDVRIAWMDARNSPNWNLYYRSSTNGGASWSGESILNSYVAGYNYIFSNGFRYPFGDYFTMTIDGQNHTQAAWGEGYNYSTPGDVWYTRQTR